MTTPDRVTLDQMVRGELEPGDPAWLALLSTPEGERAWSEARRRRRALDGLAALVWGRPWLAAAWRALRLARRHLEPPALPAPALTWRSPGLALAERDGAEGEVERPVPLAWGEVGTLTVRPGQRLLPPAGLSWRWRSAEGEGPVPAEGWRVAEGQGVVMLTAAAGGAVAAIVLVPEGENPP